MTTDNYDIENPSADHPIGRYILALHQHNRLQSAHPFLEDENSIRLRKLASFELENCHDAVKHQLSAELKSNIYRMMRSLYPLCYTHGVYYTTFKPTTEMWHNPYRTKA